MPSLSAEEESPERDAILAASDTAHIIIKQAVENGDAGKLVSSFAENAAVLAPNGMSVSGRSTIRVTAALLMRTMGTGQITITRNNLSVIDSVGYETGRYTISQRLAENKTRTFAGRFTVVWKIEEGVWKIHRAIGIR